jgi:hypothetical protein
VTALIAEVDRTVQQRRDTYRRRATMNGHYFRVSGVTVIAVASALPVLASLSYRGKDVIVAIAGALVAFLTALRSFYQWDQLWGLLRKSDLDLTHLLDRWRLDISATVGLPEPERRKKVEALAASLLDQAETVRKAESESYFGSLHFPESGSRSGKS